MDKFQIKNLIAATYVVDNSTDANRTFAISAEVNVSNGSVQNIQNGKVVALGEDAERPERRYADFSDYGSLSSSIYDTPADVTREDVFGAISDFCATLRNTQNITL